MIKQSSESGSSDVLASEARHYVHRRGRVATGIRRRLPTPGAISRLGIGLLVSAYAACQVHAAPIEIAHLPQYVTVDDPSKHENRNVLPGVSRLFIPDITTPATDDGRLCSGALLLDSSGGTHVLTAAHCLTNDQGVVITSASGIRATFDFFGGSSTIGGRGFDIHPSWNGNSRRGNDIAVLELASAPPRQVNRFGLQDSATEVGRRATMVGYGRTGQGGAGATGPSGAKHFGQNRYDALGDVFQTAFPGLFPDMISGTQLVYDFDNGNPANDAFGFFSTDFGSNLVDLGLGNGEVMAAPGDSGGPTFLIPGIVTGIVSYGLTLGTCGPPIDSPDIDFGCNGGTPRSPNASFGEFQFDTRVSAYRPWIKSVIGLPEADTSVLAVLGVALLTLVRRGTVNILSRS